MFPIFLSWPSGAIHDQLVVSLQELDQGILGKRAASDLDGLDGLDGDGWGWMSQIYDQGGCSEMSLHIGV